METHKHSREQLTDRHAGIGGAKPVGRYSVPDKADYTRSVRLPKNGNK